MMKRRRLRSAAALVASVICLESVRSQEINTPSHQTDVSRNYSQNLLFSY